MSRPRSLWAIVTSNTVETGSRAYFAIAVERRSRTTVTLI